MRMPPPERRLSRYFLDSSKRSKSRTMSKLTFLPILLTLVPFLTPLASAQDEPRHKEIDENYQKLIPFTEIPLGCDNTDNGYAIVDGGLEKCDVYLKEDKQMENHEDGDYEKYKCKHLRVNGKINSLTGKCECDHNWKGPICNEYIGCPETYSLHNGVCTPNKCQHNGQLALGSKHIECTCKAPWDGRFCERLACWRMAQKEHERRWRNAHDHCKCADGFEGENCDKIVFCKNGELSGGRCECAEGWKGELCERKCIPNQTCAAARFSSTNLFILFIAAICGSWIAVSILEQARRHI
ncbi:EGF-like domain-containing protein C02B10.3 [Ditylenchus destructor]|uniref:EGF-like domain-containing protein C02B10.3 n=1 Tax=Ditylenchus destructor TaxID=166010 RepID=A0AAD4QVK9_9BILA|nr:EGF-like domain-containing protein C02B10.3 [Ditylenchus destructor]